MGSVHRRICMRVAAGLPVKAVALAERLSEVEAEALVDDPEFEKLVACYREFMDRPIEERRARLIDMAFCELEAAALDGDLKICCFLLKETRLGRCPAESMAEAILRRMATMPAPPPPPPPEPPDPCPSRPSAFPAGTSVCACAPMAPPGSTMPSWATSPSPSAPQAADGDEAAEPPAPTTPDGAADTEAPAGAAPARPASPLRLLRRELAAGTSTLAFATAQSRPADDPRRPHLQGHPRRAQAPPR